MLQILGVTDEFVFWALNGIYGFVAKVYNIMLSLVRTGSIPTDSFDNFATTMYVLAGVFMLFRTAIGMIQMLINPDAVTDKQAGAGKLITRIITSIVMLLLFVPNGILFGGNGIFHRTEEALLKKDGLVTRISGLNSLSEKSMIKSDSAKTGTAAFLIENVYAANTPGLTCYFVNVKEHNQIWEGSEWQIKYSVGDLFKVEFYNDSSSGKEKMSGTNYSYSVRSDQRIAGKDENGKYAGFTGPITSGNFFDGSFPTSCPKSFKKTSDGSWAAQKDYPNGKSITSCAKDKTKSKNGEKIVCSNVGIYGGYGGKGNGAGGLKKLTSDLTKMKAKSNHSVESDNSYVSGKTAKVKKEEKDYLDGVSDSAIVFAQATASSLQECTKEKQKDCSEAQQKMFKSKAGNEEVIKLMDSKDLDVAFIVSLLAGVGLIVYLLVLCVEVIVRRLKLYFLEMIAPLPIISYVDPKDKIFNQWIKMYISTYLDLFIKLIAIGIAFALLGKITENFWNETSGFLEKFFYIVAILVFAKVLPKMISKIFNLDSMGSSFKDIMGLGKAALGVGGVVAAGALTAGAALGTGVKMFHATKGQGFWQRSLAAGQALGSGVGATVRGMGAAKKGNYLSGVRNISEINASRRGKYDNGLKPTDLFAASTLGKFGATTAQRTDRKLEPLNQESERLTDVNKVKDKISSIASGSDFGKYVDGLAANGKIDTSQAKKWKEGWTQAQIDFDNGNYNGFNAFRASVQNDNVIGGYTGDLNEGGKMAQIRDQMISLNDMIAGDSTISSVIGTQPITSYAGVKDADKAANDRKAQIFKEVSKVTQSSKYRTSKAALESNSGNKKS